MSTYQRRPFLGSAPFAAVLLLLLPYQCYAFHVTQYINVGTVGPSATQLCGPYDPKDFTSATYSNEGQYINLSTTTPASGQLCVAIPANTTLTGNFFIGNTVGSGSTTEDFYGTVAKPTTFAQPKYAILGVFYAPPCSSASTNSVVYGNANQLKVDNSLAHEYTQSDSVSLSGSASFSVDYVPITVSGTVTSGWSVDSMSGTDVALTTLSSENYTIDGCHGADGINHSYDIVWIWLNPVLPYYIPSSTSPQQTILVLGTGSDERDPITAQAKAPDVVTLSVLQIKTLMAVLNAHKTPTPANTGISAATLQGLQRAWDTTWATNSGAEPGPQLVVQDYQDILNADPFVANPSLDPASSTRYALVNTAYVYYDATSTPSEFSYSAQAINAASQSSGTDDQHFVSVEVSTQIGVVSVASSKLTYDGKWLWDTKSQSTKTNTSTQTATFSIWTPSASYTGPDEIVVYWDTVYQTFVFFAI